MLDAGCGSWLSGCGGLSLDHCLANLRPATNAGPAYVRLKRVGELLSTYMPSVYRRIGISLFSSRN
jgi:hypothetical protein